MNSIKEKISQERKELMQAIVNKNIFSELQIEIILHLAECVAIEYVKELTGMNE